MAGDQHLEDAGSPASEQSIGHSHSATSDWVALLRGKLDGDYDFARFFERTPGKALHSIGVPYNGIVAVLTHWQVLIEARDDELRGE